MKRTIKFRGKRLNDGQWSYGDLIHEKAVTTTGLRDRVRGGKYEVIPETICQFIGISDKNKKDIYEGDLLINDDYPFKNDGKINYIAEITYFEDTLSFGYVLHGVNSEIRGISNGVCETFELDYEDEDKLNSKIDFEIIGNIYDNPELISNIQK